MIEHPFGTLVMTLLLTSAIAPLWLRPLLNRWQTRRQWA